MKRFLLALALAGIVPVCFGAPGVSYTSYFHNTHTYTNATVAGTNSALVGVFTNSLSGAGFATSGTTNATLTGKLLADSLTATNGISAGASTFTGAITHPGNPQFLNTSTGAVTYALTAIPTTKLVKSGIDYPLYVVGNGATNTINGGLVFVEASYLGTNWFISY